MSKLELYYSPFCPYCRKVMGFMSEQNIEIDMKNIGDSANKGTLQTVSGKVQVPCLFIDGKPMFESDDIIEYLGENAVKS